MMYSLALQTIRGALPTTGISQPTWHECGTEARGTRHDDNGNALQKNPEKRAAVRKLLHLAVTSRRGPTSATAASATRSWSSARNTEPPRVTPPPPPAGHPPPPPPPPVSISLAVPLDVEPPRRRSVGGVRRRGTPPPPAAARPFGGRGGAADGAAALV